MQSRRESPSPRAALEQRERQVFLALFHVEIDGHGLPRRRFEDRPHGLLNARNDPAKSSGSTRALSADLDRNARPRDRAEVIGFQPGVGGPMPDGLGQRLQHLQITPLIFGGLRAADAASPSRSTLNATPCRHSFSKVGRAEAASVPAMKLPAIA